MKENLVFQIDEEPMTMNGEPIPETMIHVIYAIGRRGRPSRSHIAAQLSKVGIKAKLRNELIDKLSAANILIKHCPACIGKRGAKPEEYWLTDTGETIYQKYFSEPPVHSGRL